MEMWNISINACPYDHWERAARSACSSSERFHCLKDDIGQIGWICAEPIWVEGGRCPVYNSRAEMLHTTPCVGEKCPPSNYRSNDVYTKHSCRVNKYSESDGNNHTNNTQTTETNQSTHTNSSVYIFGVVGVALSFVIIGAVTILLVKRRLLHRQEHYGEELVALTAPSSTKYTQAQNYLQTTHSVVLIGVEGSGRTYLAKQLAENMKKYETCWIKHNLEFERDTRSSERKLFILDDMFYVLQTEDEVKTVASKVEQLYQTAQSSYIIVTVPSYIRKRYSDTFSDKKSFKSHVDLNTLSKEERNCILTKHLNLNHIRDEENAQGSALFIRKEVKSAIVGSATCTSIGFPSCVAWISKMRDQNDIHEADRVMQLPASRIRNEVKFLQNSTKNGDKKMFLLLAYTALSGGMLDITQVDKEFLHLLATTLYPNDDHNEFLDDFEPSLLALEERYIKKQATGKYEFQLDVVRKIIFAVVFEKYKHVLREKFRENKDLLKRHAVERSIFPTGLDVDFAKCFVKL